MRQSWQKGACVQHWSPVKHAEHDSDVVPCRGARVAGVEKFGLFVEVLPGKQGLVHATELDVDRSMGPGSFAVGDAMDVKLLEVRPHARACPGCCRHACRRKDMGPAACHHPGPSVTSPITHLRVEGRVLDVA